MPIISSNGDRNTFILLQEDKGHIVELKITRTFSADEFQQKCSRPETYLSPVLPENCVLFRQNGGAFGTTKFVIQKPPKQVVARFQATMGSIRNAELPIWFPWQVYVVTVRDSRYVSHQAYWRPGPITSMADSLLRFTTPNMYQSGGTACLGQGFTSQVYSMRSANDICKLVVKYHEEGAYNTDLNGGSVESYEPPEIAAQSIPEFYMGYPQIDWTSNSASKYLLKLHLWGQWTPNPSIDICRVGWERVGVLSEDLA